MVDSDSDPPPKPESGIGADERWSIDTHHAPPSGVVPRYSPIGLGGSDLVDGRYRIDGELGAGAMGVVYLARDVGLDRNVAVKVLSPLHADTEESIAQLQKEARSLAALRHPHVVGVYAFGEHCGAYFFVMEYVAGTDLDVLLGRQEAGAKLPLERAIAILGEVSAGLDAVHKAGLVHRDVKPANIIVEEGTERCVLVDFGLADVTLGDGAAGGTPAYCPAEQVLGAPSSPAFDVYAFGVLAFELLTGRLPFVAKDIASLVRLHDSAPVPLVSSLAPNLAPLDPVIARALDKDPANRYATATELFADLYASAEALLPRPPAPEENPKPIASVLVVEPPGADHDLVLRAIDTAFFWQPVDVASAASCADASASLRRREADLIVLGPQIERTELEPFVRDLGGTPAFRAHRVLVVRDEDVTVPTEVTVTRLDGRDIVRAVDAIAKASKG